MPGRLRKGTGLSDKAQGCCNKCCEACCRLSPWNKLLCYSLIALLIASLVLLIGGAFAADDTSNTSALLCGPDTVTSTNSTQIRANKDPEVPLLRKNANVWWLANAGIFAIIMVVMTLVCCFSYITLCCGFTLPRVTRILAVFGFILLILAFLIYVAWLILGSYLISTFGPKAALQKVCRGLVVYVIFMYIYLAVFLGVLVASCVWAFHAVVDGKDSEKKKSRDSAKSELKLPPAKLVKAMI